MFIYCSEKKILHILSVRHEFYVEYTVCVRGARAIDFVGGCVLCHFHSISRSFLFAGTTESVQCDFHEQQKIRASYNKLEWMLVNLRKSFIAFRWKIEQHAIHPLLLFVLHFCTFFTAKVTLLSRCCFINIVPYLVCIGSTYGWFIDDSSFLSHILGTSAVVLCGGRWWFFHAYLMHGNELELLKK